MGRLGTNAAGRAKGAAQQAAGNEWARRTVLVGWAAKGVVYVAVAWIVLQMAWGTAPQQASATGALRYTAGTAPGKVAMVVLGLGLLAYAVGRVLEVTVLAQPSVEPSDKVIGVVLAVVYGGLAVTAFSWVVRIGAAAYAAKGVIFLLFAWFLVQAAITYKADQAASGLDDALRRVADASWGTALLVAIAVGLLSYGLFCEVEARYRRVRVSATGTA